MGWTYLAKEVARLPITIVQENMLSSGRTVYYKSSLGILEITGTDEAVSSVLFLEDEPPADVPAAEDAPAAVAECLRQLDEYFAGTRTDFDVPVTVNGTIFQRAVWQALTDIPYGGTASYGDIAKAVGSERAVRAVGAANGKNKLTLLLPCHRIIGKNGTLTGYAGGMWRKEWLLAHEQKHKK